MSCDHAAMTVPALPPGSYLLLVYDYVDDILTRREEHRAAHLEHARAAKERGELLNVGAVGAPPSGALFVFADIGVGAVEQYAAEDSYVRAGLVVGRRVEPWAVVV